MHSTCTPTFTYTYTDVTPRWPMTLGPWPMTRGPFNPYIMIIMPPPPPSPKRGFTTLLKIEPN